MFSIHSIVYADSVVTVNHSGNAGNPPEIQVPRHQPGGQPCKQAFLSIADSVLPCLLFSAEDTWVYLCIVGYIIRDNGKATPLKCENGS